MARNIFNSNYFGDLTKMVQITFDQASLNHRIMFGGTFVDEWFSWELPQYELHVSELIGKYNLRVMAPLIADNAKTPVIDWDGADYFSGKIPRFGHKKPMDAEKMRKLMSFLDSSRISDERKKQQLIDTMFANLQDVVLGVKDSLDYMVIHALFHQGRTVYTEENNPRGIRIPIDYLMPESNKEVADAPWTDAALKDGTVNPLETIIDIVRRYSQKGISFESILCSPSMMFKILNSKNVRQSVNGTDLIARPVSEGQLSSLFSEYRLPALRPIVKDVDILKDGRRSTLSPVDDNVLVFKPVGKLGTIPTAYEDSQIIKEDNVSYADMDNGIRVSQWATGDSTGEGAAQYTQAAVRALPIITSINAVVNFDTKNTVTKSGKSK